MYGDDMLVENLTVTMPFLREMKKKTSIMHKCDCLGGTRDNMSHTSTAHWDLNCVVVNTIACTTYLT